MVSVEYKNHQKKQIYNSYVTYGDETKKFNKNLESKWKWNFEIGEMLKINKNNNIIREKLNINSSVLVFIRYEELNRYSQNE